MNKNSDKKSAIILFLVLTTIISSTFLISILARGYIPEYDNGLKIKATGLLSVNSIPKNANVFINNKLYSTTDDTINLIPADYQLTITKEGYLPWGKNISIQKEMVYQALASLFRTNPKISILINQEIINPISSPNLNQIFFTSPISTNSSKPGIYSLESNYYLPQILNQYQPKFIAQNPFPATDKTITYTFSPNSKQIIIKSNLKKNTYMIDLNQNESKKILSEIIYPNQKINTDWEIQTQQIESMNINKLPKIFTSTIATNPAKIQFSYDENKILYYLNKQYFVYDIEKDINYLINKEESTISPFWLPKSNSIIYLSSGKIKSIEYDGSNNNTIYSMDISIKNIIPQIDGEKLIITTDNKIYSLTIK